MTKTEAAASVAQQMGISDISTIEIISIEVINVEHRGNVVITTYRITYRITSKGINEAIQTADSRIAPNWTPSSQYISKFKWQFGRKANASQIINRLSGGYIARIGAKHEADIAFTLGWWAVKGFQTSYKPSGYATNYVDIDTRHNIAVEGKAKCTNRPITPQALANDIEQATRRLIPSEDGHSYNGVLLVYPKDSLSVVQNDIQLYERANPGLKVCQLSDAKRVYRKLR